MTRDNCSVPGCRNTADTTYLDVRVCSDEMARTPEELDRLLGVTQPAPPEVCAWCSKLLRQGTGPVSHGCCEPCAERMAE